MREVGIATANTCPALVVPPRDPNSSHTFLLRGGCDDATPSPMTYVSSIFSEHDEPYNYSDVVGRPFLHAESPISPWLGGSQALIQTVNHHTKETATSSDIMMDPDVKPDKRNVMGNLSASSNNNAAASIKPEGNATQNVSPLNNNNAVIVKPEEALAGNLSASGNNGARYKSMMPSRLPVIPSMYFSLPPGLSPTMLLESPVLFSAGLVDPSPTTGSFLASLSTLDKRGENDANDKTDDHHAQQSDDFVFQPHPLVARAGLPHANDMGSFGASNREVSQCENKPADPPSGDASILESDSLDPYIHNLQASGLHRQTPDTEKILAHHGLLMNGRPASDGYNWKKYGQKQLKGTERPRSYYKCTHPNCLVKKHVECSHEGEITEITYKGEHNHPKPQTTRRSARNPAHVMIPQDRGTHLAAHDEKVDSDKNSGDFSSSSAVLTGLIGTPEQSFCSPSDDEDEEDATRSDCGEEQESKRRRRMESSGEMLPSYPVPITTVREPRVVVQTISEVDILDDGYRWRKYGQKVVKGHNYPRSYYKCTNVGCGVRKHVERSSADPRSVRTTYEGKHNHNVPLTTRGNGGGSSA